jgi:FtsH-binding integral membrane protein
MFGTSYTGNEVAYRTAGEINSAMARVYGHMAVAVLISMFASYQVGTNTALMAFFFTGIMKWVVIFAPLLLILGFSVASERFGKTGNQVFLYIFSALMGLSFATIFVAYNLGSIVSAFMGGAILFIVMSGYGYFTKKDLSGYGSLLLVGLIAVIIASIVNIFIGSTVMQMTISAIAILVFLGLTAYDTQRIREEVSIQNDGIAEVRGALTLYLNFINLFLSLLQLFGERKD